MSDVEDDGKVTPIGVKFRKPPAGEMPVFSVVPSRAPGHCNHRDYYADGKLYAVSYIIRDGDAEVECSHCRTRLDPMWVLRQLATSEERLEKTRLAARAAIAELSERRRTKCAHCGKFTPIRSK